VTIQILFNTIILVDIIDLTSNINVLITFTGLKQGGPLQISRRNN